MTVNHRHLCQRGPLQNADRGLPHFLEDDADPAGFLVRTLGASFVRHLADARQKSQRPIQRSDQRADRDALRQFAEVIPAALSFFALQKSILFEFEKNEFQKLRRDSLTLGDLTDEERSVAVFLRQIAIALSPYFAFFDSILRILD
jgi:hypothetical protein